MRSYFQHVGVDKMHADATVVWTLKTSSAHAYLDIGYPLLPPQSFSAECEVQNFPHLYTCAFTHTRTHTHSPIHTHTHTYSLMRVPSPIHSQTYTHTKEKHAPGAPHSRRLAKRASRSGSVEPRDCDAMMSETSRDQNLHYGRTYLHTQSQIQYRL